MEDEKKGLSLDLNHEVALGTYSNLAIVTNSRNEFILDFASMLPGMPKPAVNNRIIMNPENAKRLLYALQNNIATYESNFGTIELDQEPKTFSMGGMNPGGAKS